MSITREQAAKLSKQLFPHANYLIRLRERAAGVLPVNDPLMLDIAKAQDAIQSLCVTVHYLSCDPRSVARAGRPDV